MKIYLPPTLCPIFPQAESGSAAAEVRPSQDRQRESSRRYSQRQYLAGDAPRPATVSNRVSLTPFQDGTRNQIHAGLPERVCRDADRAPKPSAVVFGGQSVKTTEQGGPQGYGAGYKGVGCKRHTAIDTLDLYWELVITPADIQDRDGGQLAVAAFRERVKHAQIVWVDQAYRSLVNWA